MSLAPSLIAVNWGRAFHPRDRRPIYEWARENVILPSRLTRTGPFDVSSSRQFIAPFDALQNDRVREVNICAPVRDGKTLIADVWLPYLIVNSPGPLRWVFADEKQAQDQTCERVRPILTNVPGLESFVAQRGDIEEVAGMVVAIDGPALGNLQARGYKYMIFDEPWLWPEGRLNEAKERQKDFSKLENNKLLCISQGGSQHCEDWKRQFESGLIHEWHVQCQGCGKFIQPVWSGFREDGSRWGMRWDEHREPNGFWNASKAASTARFECFHCGHAHVDTPLLKQRWNLTGKYIAENADKNDRKVSFHWSGVATYSFSKMTELFLEATNQLKIGSPKALIIFFQKQMAEFATEQTIFQTRRNIKGQKYEITSDWSEEDGRVMTVDRQEGSIFYVTIRQWSARAMQTRRLFRGVIQGEAGLVKVQEEFKVEPYMVFIDSGFFPKRAGGVYAMCIRNGWIATKGVGTVEGNAIPEGFRHDVQISEKQTIQVLRSYSPAIPADPETGVEERANLVKFASDQIADLLDGLIDSGVWIEPEDDGTPEEKDYRFQMSAEFKKSRKDEFSGREIKKRVCPSNRNHYYDCGKLQVLVAILKEWLPDPLDNRTKAEREMEKQAA